jgi:hypothetical protein
MSKKVTVEVFINKEAPPCPGGLLNITKRYFEATGVPQVAMVNKGRCIHTYLVGKHGKHRMVHPFPVYYGPSFTAMAFLAAISKGTSVFSGEAFHIRHGVQRYSKYVTQSIIDEADAAHSNKALVTQIQAVMDNNDITTYDFSGTTAIARGLGYSESTELGSNRYKKSHSAYS